jgi:PAS domain S-box-containing protein
MMAAVLDGASERAVLTSGDGRVLHMNAAAHRFLYTRPPDNTHPHVRDFLCREEPHPDNPPKEEEELGTIDNNHHNNDVNDNDDDDDDVNDWRNVQDCRIVMVSGQTTRNKRSLHWVTPAGTGCCPCGCPQTYHICYICSKHERVREVVDHALDAVFTTDTTGIIRTANAAALTMFGYTSGGGDNTAEDLVGQNLSVLCGDGHAARHQSYVDTYMATGVRHVLGTKREVTGRRRDGSEFPCELGVQEIADASTGQRFFCGFVKDLSTLKQHEAALQEGQDLAQAMINASLDPMLEIDQTGCIRIVNNAACSMFGYSREEFLGSNIDMICGGGHQERHAGYLARYLATGEQHIIGRKRQVPARRKDGSEFVVELSVQEVTLSNGKKAFCGYLRDLTAQQKDKRELRKQRDVIHGKFFGNSES